MVDRSPPVESNPTETSRLQFRLSTLFVVTLVAGVLAAFLRPRGHDLMMAGAITSSASLLFALIVGAVRPPIVERLFWGIVVAAMMQVVSATVILFDHQMGIYAWPLAAGFAAVVAVGQWSRAGRMTIAALVASTIIATYVLIAGGSIAVVAAIVACAAIGGALLAILIELVGRLEQIRKIPQSAIGLAMVLAAIGFSLVADNVIPGW